MIPQFRASPEWRAGARSRQVRKPDSQCKLCNGRLVPFDPLAGSVVNQEKTVLDFEGLAQYRVGPILPLKPVLRMRRGMVLFKINDFLRSVRRGAGQRLRHCALLPAPRRPTANRVWRPKRH